MTTTDQTRPNLTIQQETALHALLNGASQQQASIQAGVARTTVTNWVNHFIPFIQEMNRQRNERTHLLSEHGTRVAQKALTTVENAIEEGDSKLAMAYLSALGLSEVVQLSRSTRNPLTVDACLARELQSELFAQQEIPELVAFMVEDLSAATAGCKSASD